MLNSFFRNLYNFGISKIFLSADFLLSVVVILVVERITMSQPQLQIDLNPVLNVMVGLFAFVFAALAIMVSLSNSSFDKLLRKNGSHTGILFHYWYACVVYLSSILYILGCVVFTIQDRPFVLVALFLVVYSLFVTFGVVKVTISLGLYKNLNDSKSDSVEEHKG